MKIQILLFVFISMITSSAMATQWQTATAGDVFDAVDLYYDTDYKGVNDYGYECSLYHTDEYYLEISYTFDGQSRIVRSVSFTDKATVLYHQPNAHAEVYQLLNSGFIGESHYILKQRLPSGEIRLTIKNGREDIGASCTFPDFEA